MALMPHGRLGPPLWSFAADAHDCIMVLVRLDRPHTSSWRDATPVGGLPLRSLWLTPPGASCRGDQIEPDEDKKPEKKRLTEKAPYKSAPFRVGYPLVTEALSAPLQGGLRLLRRSSTPSAIPWLAVGIPPPRSDGASGAYPVVQWGKADGEAAPYSPAGHGATVVEGSIRRSDPHAILAPAYQHLWPVLDDGP